MRALLGSVMALAAVGLCACGSSGSSTTTAASGGPTSTSTASNTSVSSASSASSASTTSAGSSGGSACVAAGLTSSFLSQQGAAGHGVLVFSLRNSGAHACHTFGYPGIQFLGAGGQALSTSSQRTTSDFAGSAPLKALKLAPGQSSSFRIVVTHGAVPGSKCATASALQVIAPDDTTRMRVGIPGGAYECGTATVTPLQPGSSAAR